MVRSGRLAEARTKGTAGAALTASVVLAIGSSCAPDSSEPIEQDGAVASECDLPPGSSGGPRIRVVYIAPYGQPEDYYVTGLAAAVRHVQLWYRRHTSGGITFEVHEPVVEVVELPRNPSYYWTTDSGRGEQFWFWDNVLYDAFRVTEGEFNDDENLWLYYVGADPPCDQFTGVLDGVALATENDLRGLSGFSRFPVCAESGEPETCDRCCSIGRMASLIAELAGLDPGPDFRLYPDTQLFQADQERLVESPFFGPVDLPACSLSCGGP